MVFAIPALLAVAMRAWFLNELWRELPLHRTTSEGFDQHTYSLWAQDIAEGDLLSRGKGVFYYSPLYPYLLAGIYKLSGGVNVLGGLILNAGAGVLATLCASGLARRMYGNAAGLLAGIFLAMSGTQMANESVLIVDGVLTALALGGLWAFVEAEGRGNLSAWRWILPGVIFGVLVVGRASNALPVVALTAWLLWQVGTQKLARWAPWVFLGAASVLPLAVVARNVAIGGKWVLTSNGPINLYLGNAPGTIGTFAYPPGFDRAWARISRLPQEDQPRAWRDQLERETGASSGAQWEAWRKKMALLFSSWDAPDNTNSYFFREELDSHRWTISPYVLYVLGFGGFVLCLARGEGSRAPMIFAVAFGLSLIIVFVSGRYKLPLLGLLGVWAGGGLAKIRTLWRDERTGTLALAGGVSAVMLLFALPRPVPKGDYVNLLRPNEFFNNGTALYDAGEVDQARRMYKRGKELFPTVARFRERLAALASLDQNWAGVLNETRGAFEAGAATQRLAEFHVIALAQLGYEKEAGEAAKLLSAYYPESALLSGDSSAEK